ncbi:MAG: hypothetical protein WCO77_12800, partial [bacterium]
MRFAPPALAQEEDPFADIADQADQASEHKYESETIRPVSMPEKPLPAMSGGDKPAFTPPPKMETPAQYQEELVRMRKKFASYLANLAPAMTSTRVIEPLESFDWRLGTP